MAALPETTVVGEQGEGNRDKEECSVCLEVYEAGDTLRTMPCSHAFHGGCILGWLAVSRLCPLCRFALPPEVDSDSETDLQDGDDEVEDSDEEEEEVEDRDSDDDDATEHTSNLFSQQSDLIKMDGDGDASPAADEQPHPEEEEPLPAEAADSSTEHYPYGDMQRDFLHVLMMHRHLLHHFPAFPARRDAAAAAAYTTMMRGIVRDGILEWYDANGEPLADGGGYRNGGFGGVPASDEAIAALPETTVGEGETREQWKECAVCLEAYEAGDTLRTMPCSHGFHERCIFPWLRVSRLCPLCRFALPAAVETESDMNDEDDDAGDGEEEEEPDASDS